jgi:hypothetical protein
MVQSPGVFCLRSVGLHGFLEVKYPVWTDLG